MTSDGSPPALARLFTQLGADLVRAESVDAVLTVITRRAFDLIPSAEHAAVSRGRKRQFETVAATSSLPPKVDQIQYRLGSGPCVDAIVERGAFRSGDLETDERWPEFGREAAARYGIHSLLSIRMFVEDEDLRVGLNLYSAERDAFDESDETTATLLATHGALALTAARRRDKISNLEFALSTSRHIGAAMGILMATQKVTDDQAFDLLRIASQATHRKVTEIADDVVRTGVLELPELPEDRRR